ncbi:MAG TPA: hypothetical protein VFT63_07930 [bacterium]|nr:hypothetical protein [bacterium]
MLAKVGEMRHSLSDSSGVVGATGPEDGIDVARAIAALEDLERRVRRMLETEA